MTYGYQPKFSARQDEPAGRPSLRPSAVDAALRGRSDPRVGAAVVGLAVARLTELVEQETSALRAGHFGEIADFGARKNHALLELSRLMPLAPGSDQDGALAAKLKALRATLDTNRNVVQKHIWAVQEVSDLIANVVQQQDSDGTYSRPASSGGYGE